MSTSLQDHLLDEQQANGAISPASQRHMRSTWGWTRTMAIIGLFINGIVLCVSFFYFFSMMGVSTSQRYIGDRFMGIAIALVVFLVINIVFCILLYQYSNGIKAFMDKNDAQSFGDFLDRQKNFWIVVGIVTVVGFAFYALSVLAAVLM